MVSASSFRTRVAMTVSQAGWLREAAEPAVWMLCIGAASVLTWGLTGQFWLSALAGGVCMLLAAWRVVKMRTRLLAMLAEAERERAAMEQALLRSQKMETLGRLTAGMAHDFNNHLTVISSNIEMVARRLALAEHGLARHTDAAMQGIRRAANLTGRLLSFARQTSAEPEPVDVDRLVHGLSDLLRRALGDRVRLEVQRSAAPWLAWIDVNQMENVVLSLMVNARDRVPDGSVLKVAVSNVQLDEVFVAAHPSVLLGDHVQLTISADLGEAEPLTSADLFMAREFVRAAGGCLLCSEAASSSLSLRLFVPRYRQAAPARAPLRRGAVHHTTILVVEDDEAVRATCVAALQDHGYGVLEAPDAMEAFRLITDRGGIDLLFTDLGLPGGVSGRALADAARNLDPTMRVLFTTGQQPADLPERTATALLQKPFNPAQLTAKVQDVLATAHPSERSETVQF